MVEVISTALLRANCLDASSLKMKMFWLPLPHLLLTFSSVFFTFILLFPTTFHFVSLFFCYHPQPPCGLSSPFFSILTKYMFKSFFMDERGNKYKISLLIMNIMRENNQHEIKHNSQKCTSNFKKNTHKWNLIEKSILYKIWKVRLEKKWANQK